MSGWLGLARNAHDTGEDEAAHLPMVADSAGVGKPESVLTHLERTKAFQKQNAPVRVVRERLQSLGHSAFQQCAA